MILNNEESILDLIEDTHTVGEYIVHCRHRREVTWVGTSVKYVLIALLSDISMHFIKYPTTHKVHMHAGVKRKLLYGCAYVLEIIHSLKLTNNSHMYYALFIGMNNIELLECLKSDLKPLMHSFKVNIRVCLAENSNVN